MRSLFALGLALFLVEPLAAQPTVPLWGRWDHLFPVTAPTADITVELTSPSGRQRTVPAFLDVEGWRVRFMPDKEGVWKFRSDSTMGGLKEFTGSFVCKADPRNRFLKHGPIRVAASGAHLEHADGTPFFWLGDTVWNGPMLSTKADWATFLQDRVAKHFTGIQFNSLAPWRTAPTDREGRVAFVGTKDVRINRTFFRQLDERMDAMNDQGLLAAPVLIWANRPDDPGNALPEADVIRLLRYQVARYQGHHVLWILAGDNPYRGAAVERWKRIGQAVFGDRPGAPVTTHPTGMNWPWAAWANEKWLTILGYQSGHGDDAATLKWLHSGPVQAYARQHTHRPIINLEPPYEDHNGYQSRKPHSAYSVRRAIYWSLLTTPIAGVTYGGHGIWSWQTEEGEEPLAHQGTGIAKTWQQAMKLPGAEQMKHVANLFNGLPWWKLRPDQDLLESQPGDRDPAKFIAAARAPDGGVALVYMPVGGPVTLKGDRTAGLSAEWFDPRTGKSQPAAEEKPGRFKTPDDQDWVLLLHRAAPSRVPGDK